MKRRWVQFHGSAVREPIDLSWCQLTVEVTDGSARLGVFLGVEDGEAALGGVAEDESDDDDEFDSPEWTRPSYWRASLELLMMGNQEDLYGGPDELPVISREGSLVSLARPVLDITFVDEADEGKLGIFLFHRYHLTRENLLRIRPGSADGLFDFVWTGVIDSVTPEEVPSRFTVTVEDAHWERLELGRGEAPTEGARQALVSRLFEDVGDFVWHQGAFRHKADIPAPNPNVVRPLGPGTRR